MTRNPHSSTARISAFAAGRGNAATSVCADGHAAATRVPRQCGLRVKDFAPHLAGRMLPGLFSAMPFAKRSRFEGDPWATFPHSPTWFWMHTTECGEPNHVGSYSARPMRLERFAVEPDWISVPAPRRADQTPPKAVVADDRPSVGSMGARQPADAGSQQGALFA